MLCSSDFFFVRQKQFHKILSGCSTCDVQFISACIPAYWGQYTNKIGCQVKLCKSKLITNLCKYSNMAGVKCDRVIEY